MPTKEKDKKPITLFVTNHLLCESMSIHLDQQQAGWHQAVAKRQRLMRFINWNSTTEEAEK